MITILLAVAGGALWLMMVLAATPTAPMEDETAPRPLPQPVVYRPTHRSGTRQRVIYPPRHLATAGGR